jgi:hypothetical protein
VFLGTYYFFFGMEMVQQREVSSFVGVIGESRLQRTGVAIVVPKH